MKGYLLLFVVFTSTQAFPYRWLEVRPSPLQRFHPVSSLMMGARNFSLQLFNELVEPLTPSRGEERNVVLSPLGVAGVLGLLRLASQGTTRRELNNLSLFRSRGNINVDFVFRDFYRMLAEPQLQKSSSLDGELISSNMIFLDFRMHIYEHYYRKAIESYRTDFQTADFRERAEESRHAINNYVNHKTGGFIPQLLSDKDVTEGTEAVFANSVFLKAKWLKEFSDERTRFENFVLSNKSVIQVPMMQQTQFINYRILCRGDASNPYCGSESGPEMIELPFQGQRRKLYILLPNERISLRQIEEKFSTHIDQWKNGFMFGNVGIKLPKFNIQYEVDLKRSLQKLGIKTLFTRPNFQAFAPRGGLVSTFTHKTAIKVEEGGLAAGAGTGVVTHVRSAYPTTSIHVNKPFIFYIEDVVTHAVAFLGRVTDPR